MLREGSHIKLSTKRRGVSVITLGYLNMTAHPTTIRKAKPKMTIPTVVTDVAPMQIVIPPPGIRANMISDRQSEACLLFSAPLARPLRIRMRGKTTNGRTPNRICCQLRVLSVEPVVVGMHTDLGLAQYSRYVALKVVRAKRPITAVSATLDRNLEVS